MTTLVQTKTPIYPILPGKVFYLVMLLLTIFALCPQHAVYAQTVDATASTGTTAPLDSTASAGTSDPVDSSGNTGTVNPTDPSGNTGTTDSNGNTGTLPAGMVVLYGFSQAGYAVAENAGIATISVQRGITCDKNSPAVSVGYQSTDDTALAGLDYVAVNGTLHWLTGDCEDKSFAVTLLDDEKFEGDEKLLFSFTDTVEAEQLSATLTILDGEDTVLPTEKNPDNGLLLGSGGSLFDPGSAYQVDANGNLIDINGVIIDPLTGLPVEEGQEFLVRDSQGDLVEPITGSRLNSTGQLINPQDNLPLNPFGLDLSLVLAQQPPQRLNPASLNKLEVTITKLEAGWVIDPDTGEYVAPPGTSISLLAKQNNTRPEQISSTQLPNLSTGVAVAGNAKAGNALDEINQTLQVLGYTHCFAQQDEDGLLPASCGSVRFAFMPAKTVQAPPGTPPSLTQDESGRYLLTTVKQHIFTITAGPAGLRNLLNTLGLDARIGLDKDGVVSLHFFAEDGSGGRARTERLQYVRPGAQTRDNDSGQPPGLQIAADNSSATLVYADNTVQTVHATVPSPRAFIEEGMKIPGVERVTYLENGSFRAVYRGMTFDLLPRLNPLTRAVEAGKHVPPGIRITGDSLLYTVQDGDLEVNVTLKILPRL